MGEKDSGEIVLDPNNSSRLLHSKALGRISLADLRGTTLSNLEKSC